MSAISSSNVDALVRTVVEGNVRVCARLISRIERGDAAIIPVLQALYRVGGRSRVVGVTGPPGAGKSTLISQLVRVWRRRGLGVAVLAVDPSSPYSGGAVLGDRLRMVEHSCDEGVFIRSMAARGRLGGLAKAAGDALTVLDAMPCDVVLIETVGVGQSETDIMRHATAVLLLQTPMGGDGIQAAKAGITEIGDIYVVNKSDHAEADRTVQQLKDMIALGRRLHPDKSWQPPVVKTQALAGDGIEELAGHIDRRFAQLAEQPEAARQLSRQQAKHRVGEILQDMLERRMHNLGGEWLEGLLDPVLARASDPYALAADLLEKIG